MEAWKIIFLSKWVICRFHVNLPGCSSPSPLLLPPCVSLARHEAADAKALQHPLMPWLLRRGGEVSRGDVLTNLPETNRVNFAPENRTGIATKENVAPILTIHLQWLRCYVSFREGIPPMQLPLVLVYHGHLLFATFWEWLVIYGLTTVYSLAFVNSTVDGRNLAPPGMYKTL